MKSPLPYHATGVVFCGHGLLLRGPSGSGKSDLALRLIDAGGKLVADDHTRIVREDAGLVMRPPETIRGMIEVRGVGLLKMPFCAAARLDVVVDLVVHDAVERLPERTQKSFTEGPFDGAVLRFLRLYPFESSAVAKLRAFLHYPPVGS